MLTTNTAPIENKEEYKTVSIEDLGLSARAFNCLMRANCHTLYQLIENYDELPYIHNMGVKSIAEISELLTGISKGGLSAVLVVASDTSDIDLFSEDSGSEEELTLPDEVLQRPACDLHIPVRVHHAFRREGIETIGQVLALTEEKIIGMRNVGKTSYQELRAELNLLREQGADYFSLQLPEAESEQDAPACDSRELDIETAKVLYENYALKRSLLSEWYGVSKQQISNNLAKKHNSGNWRGRELLPEERRVITEMVNEKCFFTEQDSIKYYLFNNQNDDCAFVIVSDAYIKCFFLNDLPEALQALVKMKKLQLLTAAECAEIDTFGKTVYILKKPHFMPNDSVKFRRFAAARGLTAEDYSLLLFGQPFCPVTVQITDERIVAFLEENTVNGQTSIPSTSGAQWIRTYISRSPYNTDEFIAFYGFSTTGNQGVAELNFAEDDFYTIEEDMRSYGTGTDYIDKLFANTPLLGSHILSQKNLDTLYQNSRKYVDRLLSKAGTKPSLKDEMQIALAVINYAKEWDTEDESGFWRYITAQFGYRDENGQLRLLLYSCVKDALIHNGRWFVTNSAGNQFKSSIVVHAFSTKRSWLYFCDFLFDFYKTNLDWEYIEDDPMIARMVLSLRNRFNAANDIPDEDIEVSAKVYHFREGIIKLIVHRPKYAIQLVSSMLKRIDSLINHTNSPAVTYEEQLCDEWMANKLQGLTAVKKKDPASEKRTVAIDYTRIKPVYQLHSEREIRIVFPDVRLAQNEFSTLRLTVLHDGAVVEQRSLAFYGNELGKTMSGFVLNLEDYLRRSGSTAFDPQVVITCDCKEIYNSERLLFRECLAFKNKSEIDIGSCEAGGYSFFAPRSTVFEFSCAEVSAIKETSYLHGYYAALQEAFLIRINGELAAFDNDRSGDGIRIVVPGGAYLADYIANGIKYGVVTGREIIHIISANRESEKKYGLAINSETVKLESLPYEETAGTRVYKLEVGKQGTDDVSLRLFDLSSNRLLLRRNLKIIRSFSYLFNRPYYFSNEDYKDARVRIAIGSDAVREYPFSQGDTRISIPYLDGELEIDVPVIKVIDNSNTEWDGTNRCWINDIPQERFVYVKAPAGVSVDMTLNGSSLGTDGINAFALGNAVYGFSNVDDIKWLKVQLTVSASGQEPRKYKLGRIAVKEQFVENPVLKLDEGRLTWDLGYGYIGDKRGEFIAAICVGTEFERTFALHLDDELIAENVDIPIGEYKFSISKQSGNLFSMELTQLAAGSLFAGDINELRFLNSIIQINTITFEDEMRYEAVKIRPCYIDSIEYHGIQYVGSEDRECPVYSGVIFFVSDSGKRHEYSFEETVDEKGHRLYKMNPARIVYINNRTLSITNEDGDGYLYHSYFDKKAMVYVCQMTDWEPAKFNAGRYYLADLYSYTRKGV